MARSAPPPLDRVRASRRCRCEDGRRGRSDVANAARGRAATAALSPTMPFGHCAGCPSPISAMPASTITAGLRQGLPEAVYGPGKSPEQCARIVGELLEHGSGPVLLTRVDDAQTKAVLSAQPEGVVRARTIAWRLPATSRQERVLVCSGGTADVPVVEECAATLTAYGFVPQTLVDVGVAGLHRLLAHHDDVDRRRCDRGRRRHGRRARQRRRWAERSTGRGSADEHRIRVVVRRSHGAARDAVVVRVRRDRRRHRQRVRSGVCRGANARPEGGARDTRRVVPLLQRHRRRHDARRAARCRRGCCAGALGDRRSRYRTAGRCRCNELNAAGSQRRAPSSRFRPTTSCTARTVPSANCWPPSALSTVVRDRALATFRALAEVEGAIHGAEPDDVEFHEVGSFDAIIDIVGSCAALDLARRRRGRGAAPSPSAPARSPPPTASCRTPARPSSPCSPASARRRAGSTSTSSSQRRLALRS